MSLLSDPPLVPDPERARSLLRRELLDPDYQRQNLVERILDWLGRQFDRGVQVATGTPPLQTLAAMLVLIVLVVGLGALLSRARRSVRAPRTSGAVLTEIGLTAADLRRRAEAALGAGDSDAAVVDGFRALTVRAVEDGRVHDAPGATAHEVAAVLCEVHPDRREAIDTAAARFDAVLYGGHPATYAQALEMLALDDAVAGVGVR